MLVVILVFRAELWSAFYITGSERYFCEINELVHFLKWDNLNMHFFRVVVLKVIRGDSQKM